ncbi:MAG: hypothetical protein K0Q83_622 [Deltaproteobacteria bacterium]|jgi:hypothetical protein|nr:hypothetical protein [Deltaproteobacteria bacterium]
MPICTQQISEAIRAQQETRLLLKEGRIDKEEAPHRIANATQVILFARAAIEREKTKVRHKSNQQQNSLNAQILIAVRYGCPESFQVQNVR